jgi:hypothetical protein
MRSLHTGANLSDRAAPAKTGTLRWRLYLSEVVIDSWEWLIGRSGEGDTGKPDYRNPGAGEKTKIREESATLPFSQNFPS